MGNEPVSCSLHPNSGWKTLLLFSLFQLHPVHVLRIDFAIHYKGADLPHTYIHSHLLSSVKSPEICGSFYLFVFLLSPQLVSGDGP